jgi:hypothetical protein
MKYFVLSLCKSERMKYIEENKKIIPELEIRNAINGYNIKETLNKFLEYDIEYKYLEFCSYGTLANFLSKYECLLHQIKNNIDFMCFLEDDVLFDKEFKSFVEDKIQLFNDTNLNIIRLGKWGEGYITSLESAKRLVNIIKSNGIVHNIDNQLRVFSGKEIDFFGKTPWKLCVLSNEGDCIKTSGFDPEVIKILQKNYRILIGNNEKYILPPKYQKKTKLTKLTNIIRNPITVNKPKPVIKPVIINKQVTVNKPKIITFKKKR